MLNLGDIKIDSFDYIMIVDKHYKIIYNTRYDEELTSEFDKQIRDFVIHGSYFDVYPKLKKNESSVVRCLETGEVVVRKNQRYEDYRGINRVTNNITLPLKRNGETIAAVELTFDADFDIDASHRDKAKFDSRFNDLVKKIKENSGKITFESILTVNPEMLSNIEKAKILSTMKSPTLIYGETGTGKEVFAQAMIHYSGVLSKNVVIQNCAAVPENLIESILFGTTKGAYTGAENKKGLFEAADNGIIFLDELNSIPFHVQAKLLRVLQDGTFKPLGSNVDKRVNVKVIAAMNIDPMEAIEHNVLRKDLFYRFSSGLITLLPLKERREDIPVYVEYYMRYFANSYDRQIEGIDQDLMDLFMKYDWDGNVRELMNVVEFMVASAGEEVILQERFLPVYFKEKLQELKEKAPVDSNTVKWTEYAGENSRDIPYLEVMEQVEREMIVAALEKTDGNKSRAAELLGLPRQTLRYRMKILEIE